MSIEKARKHLEKFNASNRILEFKTSSATVQLAAEALGCAAERIAKTLSFLVDGKCILIVAAGDAKIDNSKYKAHFSTKAKMLTPDEVTSMVGHQIGGVCPFGVNKDVTIYLDNSLKRFDFVYPACGSSNSAIKLSISELEEFSGYPEWINVCKLPDASSM